MFACNRQVRGDPGQPRSWSWRCVSGGRRSPLIGTCGVGKTSLAKALSASISGVGSSQFTRPASSTWRVRSESRTRPWSTAGPIIANRVADEITALTEDAVRPNRSDGERQITVAGTTYQRKSVHGDRHAEPHRARRTTDPRKQSDDFHASSVGYRRVRARSRSRSNGEGSRLPTWRGGVGDRSARMAAAVARDIGRASLVLSISPTQAPHRSPPPVVARAR